MLRSAAERVAIRGQVIAADTGAPLARARVRAFPRPGSPGGNATTDASGRYELLVPPGLYTIQASKPAYMTLNYGQRRAFERGTLVEVRAGNTLDDVSFVLPRGAVITGAIFEPFGEPAVNVGVRVLRYEFRDGGWRLEQAGGGFGVRTDDRGTFRVYGLPPGAYYVEASPFTFFSRRLGEREYAPTFYPGTTSIEAAQLVEVDAGEEVAIDFPLTAVLTATVSGHVVDEYGRAVTGVPSVSLIRDGTSGAAGSRSSGRLEADGRFVIDTVAPGRYIAYASETGEPGRTRFATAEVSVSGERVDGVWLTLTSGASARGQIFFESQVAPDFTPDTLQPFTMPRGSGLQLPVGRGIGHVNDDWSFEIRGMAGPQLVRLAGLPQGWRLRTVALAGRDITDTPIVFSRQMPDDGAADSADRPVEHADRRRSRRPGASHHGLHGGDLSRRRQSPRFSFPLRTLRAPEPGGSVRDFRPAAVPLSRLRGAGHPAERLDEPGVSRRDRPGRGALLARRRRNPPHLPPVARGAVAARDDSLPLRAGTPRLTLYVSYQCI